MQAESAGPATSFAETLQSVRKRRFRTQEAAAKALRGAGVSISTRTLGGYERGETEPDDIRKGAILRILGSTSSATASLPSLEPSAEPPGPYSELAEVATNVVWEMRDGDRVLYAVRVTTLVAPTASVNFAARVERMPRDAG